MYDVDSQPGYDFLGPLKSLEPHKPAKVGDYVLFKRIVDNHEVLFTASDLRREKTGIHAKIEIFADKVLLDYDDFNLGRSKDRIHLANSAYKSIEALEDVYSKEQLAHDVNKFCRLVWPSFVASSMPVELAGSEEVHTKFLLRPYIVEGGGTILFAPPGRGKSYTAMLMAISVDSGCEEFWPVDIRKVLFVNLERSAQSIARRIALVNRALGLAYDRPLLTLNARGKSLRDIRDIVKQSVDRQGVNMILLDSISRAGLGSLTEDVTATNIIDLLNNVTETWVAIAHTSKKDEERSFGSIHFQAGADVEVRLRSQKKEGLLGVRLSITKENDIGKTSPQDLAYEFDDSGLSGVRPALAHEFLSFDKDSDIDPADDIYEWLLENGATDAGETSQELGLSRSFVSKIYNADDRFEQVGKNGKKVLWGVKS